MILMPLLKVELKPKGTKWKATV